MPPRRLVSAIALATVLGSVPKSSHAASTAKPPHIVFILNDDWGWNDVGFHSQDSQVQTPTMDRLAAEGVELNNYYVNPVCSPTRASLMTGRSVIHHGIQVPFPQGYDIEGVNLTYTFLPERLRDEFGYSTYAIGKWHLGMKARAYLPTSRGFDKYFGYYSGIMDYWGHYVRFRDGLAADPDPEEPHPDLEDYELGGDWPGLDLHYGDGSGPDAPVYNTSGVYSTGLFSDKAAEMIAAHASDHHATSKPMFMYLAYQGCHSGGNQFVQAPPEYIARFSHLSPNATCGQYEQAGTGQCSKAAARKTQVACIAAVDDGLARVVAALQDAGMWNNTLLVLSSDNGGPANLYNSNMMSNWPLRGGKAGYHEGGLRALGFARGPGIARPARVSDAMHHVVDWYPTLLAVAAGKPYDISKAKLKPGEVPFLPGDGVDNWAALSAGAPSARDEIIHVTQPPSASADQPHAIRCGDLKLVINPIDPPQEQGWHPPPGLAWNYTVASVDCGGPPPVGLDLAGACQAGRPCLYNITADPCEYRDLSEDLPHEVARLQARMATYQSHTVLPWTAFIDGGHDPRSDPRQHGPSAKMAPAPEPGCGFSNWSGVWAPWLTAAEAAAFYPTHYVGPGYPPADPPRGLAARPLRAAREYVHSVLRMVGLAGGGDGAATT